MAEKGRAKNSSVANSDQVNDTDEKNTKSPFGKTIDLTFSTFKQSEAKDLLKILEKCNLILNDKCPICKRKITEKNLGSTIPAGKKVLLICDRSRHFSQMIFQIMLWNNSMNPNFTSKSLRKLKDYLKKNRLR